MNSTIHMDEIAIILTDHLMDPFNNLIIYNKLSKIMYQNHILHIQTTFFHFLNLWIYEYTVFAHVDFVSLNLIGVHLCCVAGFRLALSLMICCNTMSLYASQFTRVVRLSCNSSSVGYGDTCQNINKSYSFKFVVLTS